MAARKHYRVTKIDVSKFTDREVWGVEQVALLARCSSEDAARAIAHALTAVEISHEASDNS